MKKSYTFVSKNLSQLIEILNLRKSGLSFDFLAELYNCDRTSLRYQCRKYQIFPTKTVFIRNDKSSEIFHPPRIAQSVLLEIYPQKENKWTIVDGERINTGKSYAEYLKM